MSADRDVSIAILSIGNIDEETIESTVEKWILCDQSIKRLETLKERLRDDLLKRLPDSTVKTARWTAGRMIKSSSLPDDDKFRALLESKGLNIEQAVSTKETVMLDPSKINNMIALGKIQSEEVEATRKTSVALSVKLTPKAKAFYEDLLKTE